MGELISIVSTAIKTAKAVKDIVDLLRKGGPAADELDALIQKHLDANARRRYRRKIAVLRATGGVE